MASIIKKLLRNKEIFIDCCFKSLQSKINFIKLDNSKGETDTTALVYINKENLIFDDAIGILIMHYKMYKEEWKDVENYTKADIAFWITMLETELLDSIYYENVVAVEFMNDFFVQRLRLKESIKSIIKNNAAISYNKFQEINPLNNEIIHISKSVFKRLTTEYYLETDEHFVLFNWYTTA